MQYVIAFLEGIITFISPCLLPMLPIYISYFAGGGERSTGKTLRGALGFVTGFTVVFVMLGALAGTVGSFLREYQTAVNIVSGLIVVFFGLGFLGVFKLNLFRGGGKLVKTDNIGFFPALLFGMVFSVGWTPWRGSVSWFGADAGIPTGTYRRRYADTFGIFAGTWHTVRSQHGAD